ncbi:hypothetical protein [Aureibacter tunicatorum]|uniref:Uncharacterized protein n=1 Tax=Aureibacter tunicatorum TaxID=866807 RepID=A0AAE3XPC5_9BACT|nr:hypothetical protein [Aureibacter tunicatorum]MDR6240662.1 hypothetical protein [Aureibacter tunicatorum]BDD07005.1 hypothetical protein AUTU_44880 [Aureibacter tunicatorum]
MLKVGKESKENIKDGASNRAGEKGVAKVSLEALHLSGSEEDEVKSKYDVEAPSESATKRKPFIVDIPKESELPECHKPSELELSLSDKEILRKYKVPRSEETKDKVNPHYECNERYGHGFWRKVSPLHLIKADDFLKICVKMDFYPEDILIYLRKYHQIHANRSLSQGLKAYNALSVLFELKKSIYRWYNGQKIKRTNRQSADGLPLYTFKKAYYVLCELLEQVHEEEERMVELTIMTGHKLWSPLCHSKRFGNDRVQDIWDRIILGKSNLKFVTPDFQAEGIHPYEHQAFIDLFPTQERKSKEEAVEAAEYSAKQKTDFKKRVLKEKLRKLPPAKYDLIAPLYEDETEAFIPFSPPSTAKPQIAELDEEGNPVKSSVKTNDQIEKYRRVSTERLDLLSGVNEEYLLSRRKPDGKKSVRFQTPPDAKSEACFYPPEDSGLYVRRELEPRIFQGNYDLNEYLFEFKDIQISRALANRNNDPAKFLWNARTQIAEMLQYETSALFLEKLLMDAPSMPLYVTFSEELFTDEARLCFEENDSCKIHHPSVADEVEMSKRQESLGNQMFEETLTSSQACKWAMTLASDKGATPASSNAIQQGFVKVPYTIPQVTSPEDMKPLHPMTLYLPPSKLLETRYFVTERDWVPTILSGSLGLYPSFFHMLRALYMARRAREGTMLYDPDEGHKATKEIENPIRKEMGLSPRHANELFKCDERWYCFEARNQFGNTKIISLRQDRV